MKKNIKLSIPQFMAFCIYIIIGMLLIVSFPGNEYTNTEVLLYTVLVIAYFIIVGLVVFSIIKFHIYLFEPFAIISILYIAIFIYRPIQDLLAHSIQYGGIDLTEAGIKATVFFVVGYLAFYFGYFSEKRGLKCVNKALLYNTTPNISNLVLLWFVFYVLCIISTLSSGFSLKYVFSLGSEGERIVEQGNTALLFLSNFATSLLVVWMMIVSKSKNIALKIILTVLTVIYLIVRNARWLILIMVLEPLVYYYTKKRKKPKLIGIVILGILALVMFAWMQMNRYNIATGKEMQSFAENGGLSLEILMSPFDSDLTTYTSFYGMTQSFPSAHPYMCGKTFMYVFVLFIPRAIWKTKPDNPVRYMIECSLGSFAKSNGRAVPNIGEMYANFGIIGIILLMFLFGYIVSQLKQFYEKPTENRLVIYSLLYPLMFQWVARGNFSGNFYYTLFAFIPFMIQWFIRNTMRRKL